MRIADLLNVEAMDLDLKTHGKSDTIRYLAKNLEEVGGVENLDALIEKLMAREEQSTTGVGNGIAMPHAQEASVKSPTIVFGRSRRGIPWQSFDGQDARLIFMIVVPEGGSSDHLQALASLSKVLMKEGVSDQLLAANTAKEVVEIFQEHEEVEDREETVATSVNNASKESVATQSDEEVPFIAAVTACPTGIAHTFMAEEKLKAAAQAAGIPIKVETNGQAGIANKLTQADIQKASAIIVAADKQVEMARFDGKPVIIRKVADGINKADELVAQAAQAKAPIYHADHQAANEEIKGEEGESWGRQIYKHLMNGISHMLPFVVAGGILTALSFFWGINSADPSSPEYHVIAQTLKTIGGLAFSMMLPILSGYIGQSIADRPGLVLGIMGGILADPSKFSGFAPEGIFENAVPSGFLGALVAGFLAGAIIKLLQKLFAWMPKSLEGMKSIFIFPVLGILLMGILMLFVVNGPMGAVMNALINTINSIPQEWGILLGFVVGAMMSIDMGGPINKAAYVTGTALVAQAQGEGSDVMAAVMVGGMVPPLAIGLAATIGRRLWSPAERSSAYVNYVMGAGFITEGAIPFAAADPLHVIPSLALGAGVAGALSMAFNCVSLVPHGGIFAVAARGVTNPMMYLIAWLVGGLVSALLLNFFRRRSGNRYE